MWLTNCLLRNLSPQMFEALPMYIAEFCGTMVITCTFSLVTQPNLVYYTTPADDATAVQGSFIAPIAVAFVTIAFVYAFGHISGAHFNPAITIAVYIRGFITLSDAFIFIIVQLLGAFVGALLAYSISNQIPYIEPGISHKDDYGRIFTVECVYSFAICIVVINVATAQSQRGNFFYGVSIGSVICAGIATAQRISGGAFNPAIGTALSFTNLMRTEGTIKYIWIYWLAPIIGGIFGGASYYILNAKEIEHMQLMRHQEALNGE